MITCTRRIQFAAGHRVHLHESKCGQPHGHNYVALVTAEAPALDNIGRVIDFSVLKERVGGWIDMNWDHGFIYYRNDEAMITIFSGSRWKHFALPVNPTAENLADYLLRVVGPHVLDGTNVTLVKVVVWETENCMAEATL